MLLTLLSEKSRMIATRTLSAYLKEQSLDLPLENVQIAAVTLSAVLQVEKPLTDDDLFRFPVPVLGEGGDCSLVDELADEPYDLSVWFAGETEEAAQALRDLKALVQSVNHQVGADWLGVYVVRGAGKDARLVKLSYLGKPSRAEFPLTEEFAVISNNSRVGLSGWGAVINDVAQWSQEGGSYYACDHSVNSEVCLPVLDEAGRVLGIIDAESHQKDFFQVEQQSWLVGLAVVLAEPLAKLPFVSPE
jgi:L-methionine (R)-S-oxide reductase